MRSGVYPGVFGPSSSSGMNTNETTLAKVRCGLEKPCKSPCADEGSGLAAACGPFVSVTCPHDMGAPFPP